MGDADTLL